MSYMRPKNIYISYIFKGCPALIGRQKFAAGKLPLENCSYTADPCHRELPTKTGQSIRSSIPAIDPASSLLTRYRIEGHCFSQVAGRCAADPTIGDDKGMRIDSSESGAKLSLDKKPKIQEFLPGRLGRTASRADAKKFQHPWRSTRPTGLPVACRRQLTESM
jgi:hypothetical protein